jgi:hypothetical protein
VQLTQRWKKAMNAGIERGLRFAHFCTIFA